MSARNKIRSKLGLPPLPGRSSHKRTPVASRTPHVPKDNIRAVSFDSEGAFPLTGAHTIETAGKYSEEHPDQIVVISMDKPTDQQIEELAEAWDLHPLLLEDLQAPSQRAKAERQGDTLFVVTHSVAYQDDIEEVVFGEFNLLMRGNQVAVLCQDQAAVRAWQAKGFRLEHRFGEQNELLQHGPEAVLHAVLDAVVDGYGPVLRGLETDKEEIERQVFSGDPAAAERIYRLSREIIELRQMSNGLATVIRRLLIGTTRYGTDAELRMYLDDVSDHLSQIIPDIAELRDALNQILQVNATLVSQRQNEDMKKISGWAAIIFAPTLIGAIYGMNFTNMPELEWSFGYPLALAAMFGFAAFLFIVFKKKDWM
ncbi:magnesium and cobalt transport protein CorA [Pseudoglutamicibacter cumminsii]|uniref:Magnesium transporter n=1 Tax=Pseudoglutamicibacter cumminsii TaxID=156979 RepID=A0ABX5L963_9MICC|nr:magnesium and cobalt transport protein CorA [Pseudoglutamicibacter cumminsii]PWI27432.1 magnesium transporter [Pseudoglutamicibacter cumminsii]